MNNFIKLTGINTGKPILINIEKIVCFYKDKKFTTSIDCDNDCIYLVAESCVYIEQLIKARIVRRYFMIWGCIFLISLIIFFAILYFLPIKETL